MSEEPTWAGALCVMFAIFAGILTIHAFHTHGLQNVVVAFFWITQIQAAWRR